jgi:hypothetical protein
MKLNPQNTALLTLDLHETVFPVQAWVASTDEFIAAQKG